MLRQNHALKRFELTVEGHVAFVTYRLEDGVMEITHTQVPPGLRERGVGSRLVLGVLGEARAQDLKVRPSCAFARFVIAQHPEFADLLA